MRIPAQRQAILPVVEDLFFLDLRLTISDTTLTPARITMVVRAGVISERPPRRNSNACDSQRVRPQRWGLALKDGGTIAMEWLVAGISSLLLLVYLTIAMLYPERF